MSSTEELFSGYKTITFTSEQFVLSSSFLEEIKDFLPRNNYRYTPTSSLEPIFYKITTSEESGSEIMRITNSEGYTHLSIKEIHSHGHIVVSVRINTDIFAWITFSSDNIVSIQTDVVAFIQKSGFGKYLESKPSSSMSTERGIKRRR